MKEIWKPIPSLPGVSASNLGRISVDPYEAPMPHGGVRVYGGYKGSGQWTGKRTIYIIKRKAYKLASLVCEAFHGPAPELPQGAKGPIVCMHLDKNAKNNRADNLAWALS